MQFIKYPAVSVTSGPVSFLKDGLNTQVSENTITPSLSIPLPVALFNSAGPIGLNLDFGASSGALRVAALLGNASGIAAFGAGTTNAQTLRVVLPTDQSAIPVSQSGSWSVSVPGVATEVTLSALNSKVTICDTSNVTVSSSALPSGAATEATLSSLNGKVTVCNTGAVTVASSALPTGAATESTLSTLNGKVTACNTGAVTVASSALPTGAATESTLSTINGKLNSLGQKTMANSMPVVIASDQSTIPVNQASRSAVTFVRNDYSSVNVTTAAYTQLIASTPSAASIMEIFDSSGQTLKIAFGAAASEVDQFLVFPGGNGPVQISVPASTRVSIRAVSATANAGEICINLYS